MGNIVTAAVLGNIGQGNVTSETAFPSVTGGSVRAIVGPPPNALGSSLEGRVLRVRVAIKVTTGTSSAYTPKLYWYNSVNTDLTTFTGDIGIAAPTGPTLATITRMLVIQADLYWDATSQRIGGSYTFGNDVTFTAWAGLTAAATGVVASSNLKFFLTGIFGATNASNAATITDFSLDVL